MYLPLFTSKRKPETKFPKIELKEGEKIDATNEVLVGVCAEYFAFHKYFKANNGPRPRGIRYHMQIQHSNFRARGRYKKGISISFCLKYLITSHLHRKPMAFSLRYIYE